ncbi:MAG: multicopper oxidase domain-containing protein [Flavobacteriales bacterium]|nr:multicopper oxidase domain-containing protein [Flavobacteriales bacterium]
MAHPFHIHGGSFWTCWPRRPAAAPLGTRRQGRGAGGRRGEGARAIMRFDDLTEGWPFMYHCHNLLHEDNMMMAQYIVLDGATAVASTVPVPEVRTYPVPTKGPLSFEAPFSVLSAAIVDLSGSMVLRAQMNGRSHGELDTSSLPSGLYTLILSGEQGSMHSPLHPRESKRA